MKRNLSEPLTLGGPNEFCRTHGGKVYLLRDDDTTIHVYDSVIR